MKSVLKVMIFAIFLPFLLGRDVALGQDFGFLLNQIPNDPLVGQGIWEGPGGRTMRSEQYDWYNFAARGYLTNRPENSVCLRRIANGRGDLLMGNDNPAKTWDLSMDTFGLNIGIPDSILPFNFRYIDFAKRECKSGVSGEWWPDKFDTCDENVGWLRLNFMRNILLPTGDPCYYDPSCVVPPLAMMHLPFPIPPNLNPSVNDSRKGDEEYIMSLPGRVDFSGVNFRYPAAHCLNENDDLLGDKTALRATEMPEPQGRIWYVDEEGPIEPYYCSGGAGLCCPVYDPYGAYRDQFKTGDQFLFDQPGGVAQHAEFSASPNEYGHNWCEFELPYRPHADNVLPNVSLRLGLPPTLPVMIYNFQWSTLPNIDPLTEIPGLPTSARLGRLVTDEGPKEVAVPTTSLELNFKMVERIRDTCQAFSERLPWQEESTNKRNFARFFGYRNLCDKWRGLYDRLHDQIDVLQYRLERYNYEFLRSFLDCTGPFMATPWACTKVAFDCRPDWKYCPGKNLGTTFGWATLAALGIDKEKFKELAKKYTPEEIQEFSDTMKDKFTNLVNKLPIDKINAYLDELKELRADLKEQYYAFVNSILSVDFISDLLLLIDDIDKFLTTASDALARIKLADIINDIAGVNATEIAELLYNNNTTDLINFLKDPSFSPSDIAKAIKAGKRAVGDIAKCINSYPNPPCWDTGAFLRRSGEVLASLRDNEWNMISDAHAQLGAVGGTADKRWDGLPERQPVCAGFVSFDEEPPFVLPLNRKPTHPLPFPVGLMPSAGDPTATWCDCWKCAHSERQGASPMNILLPEEPSLERRQRMGHLGPGVPYVSCRARDPIFGLCMLYRAPNPLRMFPTETMVPLPPPFDLIYTGDFVDDAQNSINCCEPRFDQVVPTPLPKKRFWCNCNDDIVQTWKCNENWCTCQQSLKETPGQGGAGLDPKVTECEHPTMLVPPGSAPFPEDYYLPPILPGLPTGLAVVASTVDIMAFVPNILRLGLSEIPFVGGALSSIPFIGNLSFPYGVMYANVPPNKLTPGCPVPYPIVKQAEYYVGFPSQCNPTEQYDRWLGCFHKARADANVILEREVSMGITPSTTVYENDNFAAGGLPKGTNLRWTGFEPNILARLPIKPVETKDKGIKGDPAAVKDDETVYKSHELTFFSQARSSRFPYMEAVIPYPFASQRHVGETAPATTTVAEELDKQGNQAAAGTIQDEYGRKMRLDPSDPPEVRPSDKVKTKRGSSQRATDAIVGARGCDIGGWYELMLYQARCIKLFRLNCICDYSKTFIEGSSEAYVLRRGGAVFNTKRYDPVSKQVGSIKLIWPLMWRGYAGPEFARRFTHPEAKLWTRARGISDVAQTLSGKAAVTAYEYKGLDCARSGDIVIWDEQLRNADGSDARSRRHVAYVEATNFTNTKPNNPCYINGFKSEPPPVVPGGGSAWCDDLLSCVTYTFPLLLEASVAANPAVAVTEWNWGKNQDACGNTNRWKSLTTRTLFKNPAKPDDKSKNQLTPLVTSMVAGATIDKKKNFGLCADADNGFCWEPNWERLKVYRPRADYYPKAAIYTAIAPEGLYSDAASRTSIYVPNPNPKNENAFLRTLTDPDNSFSPVKYLLPQPPAQPYYPPLTGGQADLARPVCAAPQLIDYCSLLAETPQVVCAGMQAMTDKDGAIVKVLQCPDPAKPGFTKDIDVAGLTLPAPGTEDWRCGYVGSYNYDTTLDALRKRWGLCEPPFELRGMELPRSERITNLTKAGQKELSTFLPGVVTEIFKLLNINAPVKGIPYFGLSERIQGDVFAIVTEFKKGNILGALAKLIPYPWSVPAPVNSGNEPRYYNTGAIILPPAGCSPKCAADSDCKTGDTCLPDGHCKTPSDVTYCPQVIPPLICNPKCVGAGDCKTGDTCKTPEGYCVDSVGKQYCPTPPPPNQCTAANICTIGPCTVAGCAQQGSGGTLACQAGGFCTDTDTSRAPRCTARCPFGGVLCPGRSYPKIYAPCTLPSDCAPSPALPDGHNIGSCISKPSVINFNLNACWCDNGQCKEAWQGAVKSYNPNWLECVP